MECPICLDEKNQSDFIITDCGHLFHYSCLQDWLKLSKNCPSCRYSIDLGSIKKYKKIKLNHTIDSNLTDIPLKHESKNCFCNFFFCLKYFLK